MIVQSAINATLNEPDSSNTINLAAVLVDKLFLFSYTTKIYILPTGNSNRTTLTKATNSTVQHEIMTEASDLSDN